MSRLNPYSFTLALVLLSLLTTVCLAESITQKPAAWVQLSPRLDLITSHRAELTLQLGSPFPTESVEIRLHLSEGIVAREANPWRGKIQPGQSVQLSWLLSGSFEHDKPVGIEIRLQFPDGETLIQQDLVHWPDQNRKRRILGRTSGSGSHQSRHGEALWVIPLTGAD